MKRLLSLLLLAAPLSPLHAKWMEASSSHFVIYADDTPAELQKFSEQLERFHEAMGLVLSVKEPPPSPSSRVTVYVVRSDREVRKLAGDGEKFLYAFYSPRAGGSFAIVPAVDARSGLPDFSMIALLHEYAHHFQLSASRHSWPRWFVEGSAEFLASAKFDRDNSVTLGLWARHRTAELTYALDVTARDLLDPDSYEKKNRKSYDAFYGKSWLLYHYLTFAKERPGQLVRYLQAMVGGQSSAEAARAVFGDLDQLEKDLQRYQGQRTITSLRIAPAGVTPGPVTLRTLSVGEAAMMPVRIRSRRGVTPEQATALLPEARAIAARFPGDAAVLTALAEAEHDAGHDDTAIAAADAALAIDPSQVNAYVQKGLSMFRKAQEAPDKALAYRAARAPFVALNKIENDHPLPLLYFYMGFRAQGIKPTPLAVQALERAVELAPFDPELRFSLVSQQIYDKAYDKAMINLAPLAYNPHGGQGSEMARKLLDRLKAHDKLDDVDPANLFAGLSSEGDQEPAGDGGQSGKGGASGGKKAE